MNRQNEGKAAQAISILMGAINDIASSDLREYLREVVHEFQDHPGGSSHHHGYRYGLLIHTAEVVKLAPDMAAICGGDPEIVKIAAIMHDYGKIHDYSWEQYCPSELYTDDDPNMYHKPVIKLPGFQKAAHIVASYDKWQQTLGLIVAATSFHTAVGKCILSHHGQLEWGSVLTPSTPEEWCLHLADMASANAGVIL